MFASRTLDDCKQLQVRVAATWTEANDSRWEGNLYSKPSRSGPSRRGRSAGLGTVFRSLPQELREHHLPPFAARLVIVAGWLVVVTAPLVDPADLGTMQDLVRRRLPGLRHTNDRAPGGVLEKPLRRSGDEVEAVTRSGLGNGVAHRGGTSPGPTEIHVTQRAALNAKARLVREVGLHLATEHALA